MAPPLQLGGGMTDETTTLLWTLGRGAGAAAFLLLTASMLLGILSWSRFTRPTWPRVATTRLHRNLSLLGLGFVGAHLMTMLLDRYAHVEPIDVVVPFGAGYEPLWVGLGTIALWLVVVLNATSLAQRSLGWRRWRAIHWVAYACWPVAALHAVGAGSDARSAWLLGVLATSIALVVPATLARIARARAARPHVQARLIAGTLAVVGTGIAAVALTDIGRHATASANAAAPAVPSAVAAPAPTTAAAPTAFALPLDARLTSDVRRDGSARAMIDGTVGEGDGSGRLRAVISGVLADDGLVPERIDVAFAVADGGAAYSGTGELVASNRIAADVRRGDQSLHLVISLGLDQATGAVTGTVDGTPGGGGADDGSSPSDDGGPSV